LASVGKLALDSDNVPIDNAFPFRFNVPDAYDNPIGSSLEFKVTEKYILLATDESNKDVFHTDGMTVHAAYQSRERI